MPENEKAGPVHGRGETILIVEDDEGVRQYASEILRDLNYQVIEAKDSAAALRLLDAEKPFDLLLTDVVLPGKNGRELADEVKRRRPDAKIIFMTGYSRHCPPGPTRPRCRADFEAAHRRSGGEKNPPSSRRALNVCFSPRNLPLCSALEPPGIGRRRGCVCFF
jgi:CheY-like chemotaxis protein